MIGLDWTGPDRTHKTWIASNSIKETHIYLLKVGTFQTPIKNGQVVSREIKKVIVIVLFLLFLLHSAVKTFCLLLWFYIL